MESAALPPDIATPPLALVALLGPPAVTATVADYLRTQARPPINSLEAADPLTAAPRAFPARKPAPADPDADAGVFKADWFAKHRQRRPAVAALFLERSAVTGAPADWAAATQALDVVRAAAANRDARVLVVVVGEGGEGESTSPPSSSSPPPPLPEDRLAGLCRQGCIEPSAVVCLSLAEGASGLRRLARALASSAGEHYAADAARRVAACAARAAEGAPPPPAAVGRAALKAGALAEFRGDWVGAVREYLAAHGALVAALAAEAPPPQRARELAAVAEVAATKAATLLHHQRRSGEAARLMSTHVATFGVRAAVAAAGGRGGGGGGGSAGAAHPSAAAAALPPGVAADAWRWTARAHAAAAALLVARASPASPSASPSGTGAAAPPSPSAAAAARLLADAARAEVRAARATERAAASLRGEGGRPPDGVVRGAYLGQAVALGPPPRRLNDREWAAWLAAEATTASGGDAQGAALARLEAARAAALAAGPAARREAAQVAVLTARELLLQAGGGGGGDAAALTAAAADLAAATATFRAEGWAAPLADALLVTRDAATRAGDRAGAAAAALEAAALAGGLDAPRRAALAATALADLASPPPSSLSDGAVPQQPLELRIGPGGHPGLAAAFSLWASFDDGGRGGGGSGGRRCAPADHAHPPPPSTAGDAPALLWLGLATALPADVALASVEVEVADAAGRAVVPAVGVGGGSGGSGRPKPFTLTADAAARPPPSARHAATLAAGGAWTPLVAAWTPRAPGAVRLVAVRAWLGGSGGGGGGGGGGGSPSPALVAWHAADWVVADPAAAPAPSPSVLTPTPPPPAARRLWPRRGGGGAPAARSGGGAHWAGVADGGSNSLPSAPAHLARAPLCLGTARASDAAPLPFRRLAARLGGGAGSGAGSPPWAALPAPPLGLWEADVAPAGGPPRLALLGPAVALAGEATPLRVRVWAPPGGSGLARARVRVAVVDAAPCVAGRGGGGGGAPGGASPPHKGNPPPPASTTLSRPPAILVRGPGDLAPLSPDTDLDLGPVPAGGVGAAVDVGVVLDHAGAAAEVEATLSYWAGGGGGGGGGSGGDGGDGGDAGPAAAVRASATLVAASPLALLASSFAGPPLAATMQAAPPTPAGAPLSASSSAPLPAPLPTGEDCVVTVTLGPGGGGTSEGGPAAAAITVLGVDLAPTPGTAAVPRLAAPGVPPSSAAEGGGGGGVTLGPGDELTSVFGVRRDDKAAGAPPESLGDLVVTWARAAPPALRPLPPGLVGGGGAGGVPDQCWPGPSFDGEALPALAATPATTTIALPPVAWAPSRLTARLAWPGSGGKAAPPPSTGAPLHLTLACTAVADGDAPLPAARLALTVTDAPGFVIAGRRRGWVALLPPDGGGGGDGGAHCPVSEPEPLTLIPHAAGPLALPSVSLFLEDVEGSGGGSVACCVTAGAGLLVRPAVVGE